MPDFLKESYSKLFKILHNWTHEPERPPLLINGLPENDLEQVIAAIIKLIFGKEVPAGHPDVLLLEKDSKKTTIEVEKTRKFIGELALSHFELPYKLGIIPAAPALSPASQNALLKTLEEPLPNRYLIMGAAAKNLVLPTILSRSTVINIQKPIAPIDKDLLEKYSQWKKQTASKRLKEGEQWAFNQPEAIKKFFDFAVNNMHLELIESLKNNNIKKTRLIAGQLARALNYSEQLQRTSGANPKLLFESFLLNTD